MDESRRRFIKGSGAAIAGVGILGSAGAAVSALNTQSLTVYASDATEVGEAAYITGDIDELGNWGTAYKMYPQSSYWKHENNLPVGTEFKIVRDDWIDGTEISTAGVEWEHGSNHVVEDGKTIYNLYPDF